MSYKSILLHVESAAEARTKLAFDLARRHDALLIGLSAAMWIPSGFVAAPEVTVTAEMVEVWREQVQGEIKRSAEQFHRLADEIAVRTEWRSLEAFPHDALCNAANAADLIIVGPLDIHADPSQLGLVNPGDLLIGAGRPVMVVPGNSEKVAAQNIIVAWKNTREARRAVADALPILSAAETVSLVQVKENDADAESINDVHQYLSCHGIEARIAIDDSSQQEDVAAHLIRHARKAQSDLIVSGAYGRSRLREWAFGGVTRSLLTQNSIACQLSH